MDKRRNKRKIGGQKEEEAVLFLQKKGYEILERNFWCRFGEIDIIARQSECFVFCEVKFRGQACYGAGIDSVDRRKCKKILRAAECYLQQKQVWESPCRFDVIWISKDEVFHYENAFEAEE